MQKAHFASVNILIPAKERSREAVVKIICFYWPRANFRPSLPNHWPGGNLLTLHVEAKLELLS